jgi:hypothetical protein
VSKKASRPALLSAKSVVLDPPVCEVLFAKAFKRLIGSIKK